MPTMLKILAKAPNFILPDAKGRDTVLDDFTKPWILLVFFPGRFGARRAGPLRDLQQSMEAFEQRGVQVLGIGLVRPPVLDAWTRRNGFSFPILWDRQKRIARRCRALGALGLDCRPLYYLLNSDRRVVYARTARLPFSQPSSRELLAAIDSCQAADKQARSNQAAKPPGGLPESC
jgi:peroxiredoxin